ncbi:hypothetical protein C8A05DRAFT_43091 [Staphylotrichum tortipilum]|uniref:G-protein coupled receptors family 2 profile 2 domain-containing protein n=1 Tax=Staphylotrichum tortipilum TaxID=2831512 RepID=A0AAN6MML4_9PEZI|nr:hypothetical protein C8A05DRAFT_43091 [Staphylotrichum longicolle]
MLHLRGEAALDAGQLQTLTIVTRVASILSALGVITIITTYCISKHFRNPMHRLIVINAFYNALDVTCTMISTSGPAAGNTSALCQFQGFLNQMFPIADVLWTLAMAVNVYLIVHRSYDVEMLRRLEWKYMIIITVVTFIPAFVFLFIKSDDNGSMYGSVTLWCAIAPKWVIFRIVLYYVPIWSSIVVTIGLYLFVGIEIARRRRILRSISSNAHNDDTVPPAPEHHPDSSRNSTTLDYDDANPHAGASPTSTITTATAKYYAPTTTTTITTKYYSSSTTPIAARINPTKTSSLSFRQYILMPLFFFLAMLTVWVAPSTNRVASFINPTFSSYPLLLLVGITGSMRGFWNGIVFVVVGMRSWKRRKEADEVALRPVTR